MPLFPYLINLCRSSLNLCAQSISPFCKHKTVVLANILKHYPSVLLFVFSFIVFKFFSYFMFYFCIRELPMALLINLLDMWSIYAKGMPEVRLMLTNYLTSHPENFSKTYPFLKFLLEAILMFGVVCDLLWVRTIWKPVSDLRYVYK